jgi:septal ring factor EnvC (AmiA/AmiB activator)
MPDQPAEKPTTQLPAVPAWAVELTQSVKSGIAELRADVALVSNDLGVVKDRVAILESFRNDQETRASRTSARVQQSQATDLEQAAQLAQERAAREELAREVADLTTTQATQLAILTRLDKITSNPTVKVLAGMAATAALTWLATHGGSLK